MLRVNYLHPEQMPTHQRDFPRRERDELRRADQLRRANDSRGLALMVAGYLVALFAGILLLGYLTAPDLPNSTTAAASATLTK
jgi:hypothetical protein